MNEPSDAEIRDILTTTRLIAMVGASPNPARPSFGVLRFLLRQGYRVIAVNPGHAGGTMAGAPVAGRLADIGEPIDMVDVFRRSEALPELIEEILSLPTKPKVIWTQLGVQHEEAAATARAAGIRVVMNRCPAIEIPRLGIPPVA